MEQIKANKNLFRGMGRAGESNGRKMGTTVIEQKNLFKFV